MKTHWFPLRRPAIKPVFSWGAMLGGGRLISHKVLFRDYVLCRVLHAFVYRYHLLTGDIFWHACFRPSILVRRCIKKTHKISGIPDSWNHQLSASKNKDEAFGVLYPWKNSTAVSPKNHPTLKRKIIGKETSMFKMLIFQGVYILPNYDADYNLT